MDKILQIAKRRRACQMYRIVSVFQFSAGFLLVFFAAYIAGVLHGAHSGAPYYAGAFIAGLMVMILGVFGGVVYHRGNCTRLEILIPTAVKPWVIVYIILAPCAAGLCTIGTVITGIYGLCRTDKCSYTTNTDINLGMTVVLFVLEIFGLISTFISIFVSIYFADSFTLITCFHKKTISGTVQVQPVIDELQIAQDMAALQMWRHRMENDVDFKKVADYLEKSRKREPEENF